MTNDPNKSGKRDVATPLFRSFSALRARWIASSTVSLGPTSLLWHVRRQRRPKLHAHAPCGRKGDR
jgi:hypothetical protein